MAEVSVDISTPNQAVVTIVAPGPQGPAGLQNVHVGPMPPENPIPNMIWIKTQ